MTMSFKREPMNDKTLDGHDEPSTKRTRVTKACDVCRRKKIRCQFENSERCINCIQYGWDCTYNDTTRKRGPPKGYIESLENRLRKMEVLLESMNSSASSETHTKDTDLDNINKNSTTAIHANSDKSKVVRYLGSSSGYYLVKNILTTDNKDMAEIKEDQQRRSSLQGDYGGSFRFRNINVNDDDIMCVRDTTLAERVDQLQEDRLDFKEDIAPKSLIDRLIARYFESNYTSFPVIDKEPFLNAYHGHTQSPPPPILTYAICMHACFIIPRDDTIFEDAGVERKAFLETLSAHASNLIKKEYLKPRLENIQALVLLSGSPSFGKMLYKNWLRVGMAVRMAQELGLHRTLDKLPLTEEMFEANKRLWYCVYAVDRWCCAVMGRPLSIADADCDIDLPHIKGGVHGGKDYSLFVNFVKLSGILGEVLRRVYSPRAKSQGYKTVTAYHTVQSIYRMLNDWLEQLPDHQRITPEEARLIYENKTQTAKIREAGPLMVCYHTVNVLLYRTFLISDRSEVWPELHDQANHRCTEAAKYTIDIARLLFPTDVIHFGFNFAGFSVFQASLIHVYNCISSNLEVANTARQYVQICIEECIEPMDSLMDPPTHAAALIRTLLSLIGAEKKESIKEELCRKNITPSLPKAFNFFSHSSTQSSLSNESPSEQKNIFTQPIDNNKHRLMRTQTNASPMSVNAITSGWENRVPGNIYQSSISSTNNNNNISSNISSTAAWQSLFASAATQLFDNDVDWQTTLSTLFDDNQLKQHNNFF